MRYRRLSSQPILDSPARLRGPFFDNFSDWYIPAFLAALDCRDCSAIPPVELCPRMDRLLDGIVGACRLGGEKMLIPVSAGDLDVAAGHSDTISA